MPLEETISLIKKGNRGDKVKITVRREDKDIDITISKDIITTPTVSYSIANKDEKKIAKIVISNFSKNTFVEFKDIYNEIKKEKVDGIILDLRGNGGGYLSSASLVASMFLDKDKVIYIEKIKDKEEKIFSKDERIIKEKTVVLIDGGTASASEILASALRINNDAQLIGTTTYGKNTIQKIHKLKDGALVKFTIGEWFNANEKSILEEPLTPDKEVTYVDGSDMALTEALNMF
jgi:carboxyl-terminal processing protease